MSDEKSVFVVDYNKFYIASLITGIVFMFALIGALISFYDSPFYGVSIFSLLTIFGVPLYIVYFLFFKKEFIRLDNEGIEINDPISLRAFIKWNNVTNVTSLGGNLMIDFFDSNGKKKTKTINTFPLNKSTPEIKKIIETYLKINNPKIIEDRENKIKQIKKQDFIEIKYASNILIKDMIFGISLLAFIFISFVSFFNFLSANLLGLEIWGVSFISFIFVFVTVFFTFIMIKSFSKMVKNISNSVVGCKISWDKNGIVLKGDSFTSSMSWEYFSKIQIVEDSLKLFDKYGQVRVFSLKNFDDEQKKVWEEIVSVY